MHNHCPRVEFACVTSSIAEFERPNILAGRLLMAYYSTIGFLVAETSVSLIRRSYNDHKSVCQFHLPALLIHVNISVPIS